MSTYLVPQRSARSNGFGPSIELGEDCGKLLVITLGINEVLEHEEIGLLIWGSADNFEWGAKPLVSIPSKSECGIYCVFLNLADTPDIHYVRAEWRMRYGGAPDSRSRFSFYISSEVSAVLAEMVVA